MKNQSRAYFFASITVLFWATVATAFKIALRDINYIQLLAIANLTSFLIFLIIIIAEKKMTLVLRSGKKDLLFSAFQGLLNPFAYYLIVFKAYSLLPAQVAQPANFIWPVVLTLLSVPLLKQPFRITGVVALLISFTGVLILASEGQLQNFRINEPTGLALALLSSLIWAFFWIFNVRDQRDDLLKLFLSFGFSLVYIMVLALITGDLKPMFSKPWLPAVYVGIFEMGLSFLLWLKAIQLSETTGKVANLIYLTPFLSLLVIHYILHEHLYYTSVIGLCLIVAGILVSRIKK